MDYPKPSNLPGLKTTVHNKVLGYGWLSIYNAEAQGFDPAGGPWVTVCEVHHTVCNHRTYRMARHHLPSASWCEACQACS